MSRKTYLTLNGLRAARLNKSFVPHRLVVLLEMFFEHIQRFFYERLKYVQYMFPEHKQTPTIGRKNDKSVQTAQLFWGGTNS
jgi:hypothetical protein